MFAQVKYPTRQGVIYIEGPVPCSYIENLCLNRDLRNFRPPEQQKKALMAISDLPEGMVYIARHGDKIIGYVTFHQPDPHTRWSRHPRILEMGAIEISPAWRKNGIGEYLLKNSFANKKLEHFIVITLEYCWHWDLKNSGLDIWQYRRVLGKVFGRVGLVKTSTDDPEIMEHPANTLMVKIGSRVAQHDTAYFETLRYQTGYNVMAGIM